MAAVMMADPARADIFHSVYGYGAYGAQLAPPVVLTATFWDDQKIHETVNARFLREKFSNDSSRKRLDSQLAYGEGLTESTYGEWILEHTKRFFLIFLELGCPEKVFDIIDEPFDDDDLPLSPESIARLELGTSLEKKFAKKQYQFLVRELGEGQHVDYMSEEIVPLEVIGRRQAARSAPAVEKVYFPRQRDVFYSRKRVLLGDGPNLLPVESFMAEIDAMKYISHDHIALLHTSYTQQGIGYLILSPSFEYNLRSFLQYPSITFKALQKEQRRRTVLDWMHCLSDALAYLREKGISHGDIKPSSIIIDPTTHQIFFADIGNSKQLDPSRSKGPIEDVEAYEYGAPERWLRSMTFHESAGPPSNTIFSGRAYRKTSHSSTTVETASTSPVSSSSIHLGQWTVVTSLPSQSDVFSLACIFLDILTFYVKRKSAAFCAHRSAKHRRSRESAPPDASFHANLGQVDSWVNILDKDAAKKNDTELGECLQLCREMLQRDPRFRPEPRLVADHLYRILLSALKPEMPHCGLHKVLDPSLALFGGWEQATPRDRTSLASSGMRSSGLSIRTTTSSLSGRWTTM